MDKSDKRWVCKRLSVIFCNGCWLFVRRAAYKLTAVILSWKTGLPDRNVSHLTHSIFLDRNISHNTFKYEVSQVFYDRQASFFGLISLFLRCSPSCEFENGSKHRIKSLANVTPVWFIMFFDKKLSVPSQTNDPWIVSQFDPWVILWYDMFQVPIKPIQNIFTRNI